MLEIISITDKTPELDSIICISNVPSLRSKALGFGVSWPMGVRKGKRGLTSSISSRFYTFALRRCCPAISTDEALHQEVLAFTTPRSSSTDVSDRSGPPTIKAVSKEIERVDQLFHTYVDKSLGMVGPEGIESFCSEIGVHYTDVRILILAWKMKAEKQGYFTLEEWRKGLRALHADTIIKIKKRMPNLEREVMRPTNFLDFYACSFRYCLTKR
ncbi:hypothetical protein J5N97_030234 [Dioscorea zingiberensis]|uniref:Defective in cullin neddylation protein n=1 Tax=Dioscorea zingiberensis TaxID=325984 RepID=A0A9D5BX42_9LILI|nr:hypothetical protein J5N97_030234 [Dioscorea zingiberensis]